MRPIRARLSLQFGAITSPRTQYFSIDRSGRRGILAAGKLGLPTAHSAAVLSPVTPRVKDGARHRFSGAETPTCAGWPAQRREAAGSSDRIRRPTLRAAFRRTRCTHPLHRAACRHGASRATRARPSSLLGPVRRRVLRTALAPPRSATPATARGALASVRPRPAVRHGARLVARPLPGRLPTGLPPADVERAIRAKG